jgi:hypothetical protein
MLFAAAVIVVVTVVVACLNSSRCAAAGSVAAALRAVRSGDASPQQRRLLASEARRRGFRDVAEDLATQADMHVALDHWSQRFRSPVDGVTDTQWSAWVEANELLEPRAEWTPVYGLRERELDDAGLDVPMSESEEYEALVSVTRSLRRAVEGRFAGVVGTEIEGQTATLSGLLAVARCAGLGGLATWLNDVAERAKFGRTTQAYKRATGIF